MRLRELRFEDYEASRSVLARNGLRAPTREQWAHLCGDAPQRAQLSGIPLGWLLERDGDGVVGTLRNIPFLYEWNTRPVRVAVASGWAVDPACRHQSLALAAAYFRQAGVDVLLNTTAAEDTAAKAFAALGAERVPQPGYTTRLLWITGYLAFADHVLRERGIPGARILRYPAALGARVADTRRRRAERGEGERVSVIDRFDARFDRFWSVQRLQADRLQAVRDSAALQWRFALERQPMAIVVLERGSDLAGYAVLVRRDQGALRRFEVADLQALEDAPARVRRVMDGALRMAAANGVQVVALSGFNEAKRRALTPLAPYMKTSAGWPLFYKAVDAGLREPLRAPPAWDLSAYDGDALWSAVFSGGAAA
ncbi:MAG: hypothetical protein ACHQO8_08320 [Vicinamibacterales bacterium]